MKTAVVSILLILCCFAGKAQRVYSLQQALETGIKNNFDVNQAGLLVQKENANLVQSKLARLPDLNASAGYGINQGRSIDPFTNQYVNENVSFSNYNASSNLLLFNGFSLNNLIESNKLSYQASQKELQQAKDNLTIQIILAYLNVLKSEDVLEQSKQQINVSEKQVDRLEVLNKEGAVTPSELFDLKGELASNQLIVADNEAAVAGAKLALCQLMNIPYDKNMEAEKVDIASLSLQFDEGPEDIYQQALKTFAQIRSTELRSESSASYAKAARGKLFPVLSLSGNVNTNYSSVASQSIFQNYRQVTSDDYISVGGADYAVIKKQPVYDQRKINFKDQLKNNLFTTFSLNLSIPLFNAGRVRNSIRLADLDVKNYELQENNAKVQLQQAIEQAYVNLTNSQSRIKILNDQVQAFSESFRSAEIRFNNGVITSVDYLVAKNNFDRAQINLIASKYDFLLRRKILDYYKGSQLW